MNDSKEGEWQRKPTQIPRYAQDDTKVNGSREGEWQRKPTQIPRYAQDDTKVNNSREGEWQRKPTQIPRYAQDDSKEGTATTHRQAMQTKTKRKNIIRLERENLPGAKKTM